MVNMSPVPRGPESVTFGRDAEFSLHAPVLSYDEPELSTKIKRAGAPQTPAEL